MQMVLDTRTANACNMHSMHPRYDLCGFGKCAPDSLQDNETLEIHIWHSANMWITRLYMPVCGLQTGEKAAFDRLMDKRYVDNSVEIVESFARTAY